MCKRRIMNFRGIYFGNGEETAHGVERVNGTRGKTIRELDSREPNEAVATFYVDSGHQNGAELHTIYENAIVRIYNKRTGKHITDIIATPSQIARYYENTGKKVPQSIMRYASIHKRLRLNK